MDRHKTKGSKITDVYAVHQYVASLIGCKITAFLRSVVGGIRDLYCHVGAIYRQGYLDAWLAKKIAIPLHTEIVP